MKSVTTYDLCAKYGVQRLEIQRWLKAGCPVKRRGRGNIPALFLPDKVQAWLDKTGRRPKGMEGAAMRNAGNSQKEEPAQDKNNDAVRQYGIMGYLERCRRQERYLYGRFVALTNSNAPGGEIAAISRALTAKGEELRRAELAALEHQKLDGELVNLREMQQLFVQLASAVRERVMALPNELAPVLRDYLRDTDDVGKVRDELDVAIRHALQSLPDELPQGVK